MVTASASPGGCLVLLAPSEHRRKVWEALSPLLQGLVVLGYDEISRAYTMRVFGTLFETGFQPKPKPKPNRKPKPRPSSPG